MYICVSAWRPCQMTAMTQGNRDLRHEHILSRSKACRILAARQELKLKGNGPKRSTLRLDVKASLPRLSTDIFLAGCNSGETTIVLATPISKVVCSNILRHLSTAIHLQPRKTFSTRSRGIWLLCYEARHAIIA